MPDIFQQLLNLNPAYQRSQTVQLENQNIQSEIDARNVQTQERQQDLYARQIQLQQQKKLQDFQARMAALNNDAGYDPKNPDSVADHLAGEAQEYEKAGFPNEAFKLYEDSIKLRQVNANARRAAAQDTLAQLKVEQERNEGAAAALYGVQSQGEMDKALKGTKLEGMRYTGPESVSRAREQLMSVKEQLDERHKNAQDEDNRIKANADAQRAQAQREHYLRIDAIKQKEATTKAGKESSKAPTTASKNEVIQAQDLIVQSYPDLKKDPEALKVASEVISNGAKRRVVRREVPDFAAGVYKEMQERANSFKNIGQGYFSKGSTTFVGGGDAPEEAIPVPAGAADDPSLLVEGKWYDFGGRAGQWTGTGVVWGDDTPSEEKEGEEDE
jgi:hypothetical protein